MSYFSIPHYNITSFSCYYRFFTHIIYISIQPFFMRLCRNFLNYLRYSAFSLIIIISYCILRAIIILSIKLFVFFCYTQAYMYLPVFLWLFAYDRLSGLEFQVMNCFRLLIHNAKSLPRRAQTFTSHQ